MAYEVVMPQMGAEMKEGTLIRWLKNVGDEVARGETIAEIETDKANVEIEAFEGGVFRKTLAQPGDVVAVGQVIAVIAAPDEVLAEEEVAAAEKPAPATPPPAEAPPRREERPAPPTAVAPPATAPAAPGRLLASPVARKMAEERGIDLSRVRGSGPEGRITRSDVEAYLSEQPPAAVPTAAEAKAAPPAEGEVVPMTRMRQTIALRMTQSKRQAPHYYLVIEVDMSEGLRLRAQLNSELPEDGRVSVNDMLVKATAIALMRYPMFNTWFVDGEVRRQEKQNVCIAIALEEGLIAPAIVDCGAKSLAEIARASRDLAERSKSGTLKAEEYSGGTFTVSNLGMFGVDQLIAIIQPPQTAILGVGTVRATPVARDGAIAPAEVMKLALSGDHRVTDGAQGAQFLAEIKRLLEAPALLLL